MELTILVAVISAAAAVFASTGFWAYITRTAERDTAEKNLLMGLAHDRLISQSTRYINRGFISHEEYEDLRHYLYDPYLAKGGDGTVEKMMKKVDELPVRAVSDMVRAKEKFYGLADSTDKKGGESDG